MDNEQRKHLYNWDMLESDGLESDKIDFEMDVGRGSYEVI